MGTQQVHWSTSYTKPGYNFKVLDKMTPALGLAGGTGHPDEHNRSPTITHSCYLLSCNKERKERTQLGETPQRNSNISKYLQEIEQTAENTTRLLEFHSVKSRSRTRPSHLITLALWEPSHRKPQRFCKKGVNPWWLFFTYPPEISKRYGLLQKTISLTHSLLLVHAK